LLKKIYKLFLWIIVWLILSILIINFYVLSFSKNWYFQKIENLPEIEVWLVFWASVKKNWIPSDILKDRLQVAYETYKAKKIKKIIVSGYTRKYYNEPEAMKKYLIKLWVKQKDIWTDYDWIDTYNSIYKAKKFFKLKKIVLFTQDFHLKRALYIWKKLWLEIYWLETNKNIYLNEKYNNFREIWARIKAFFEVEILSPKPKYLENKIEKI